MGTKIEWSDETWNPVTGCSKVSQGCKNCYALREWPRLSANPKTAYYGRKFTDVEFHPERLYQPLHWTRQRMVFVNSMSDLFHEKIPTDVIDQVFAVMALALPHTFQVLTKRPQRMWDYFQTNPSAPLSKCTEARVGSLAMQIASDHLKEDVNTAYWDTFFDWPLRNVWLGVSAEDQETADERIPHLLYTPASVRFVSYEPALGPVNLGLYLSRDNMFPIPGFRDPLPGINWVIAGGESGPKARPAHPDWFRSARDQCDAARVSFFFKQWGEWAPERVAVSRNGAKNALYIDTDGSTRPARFGARGQSVTVQRNGKKVTGRKLDGRTWEEYPS